MKPSVLFVFSTLCLLWSCQEAAPAPEPLDPALVDFAGENYKEFLIEEIRPAASDTIDHLVFERTHFAFDLKKSTRIMSYGFKYKNSGINDSQILKTISACNCIHNKSVKEIVKAGQSAELNITFNPQLWEVNELKTLYVFTKHYPHQIELIIERNK